MSPLYLARDLLRTWELGHNLLPTDRALFLIFTAFPEHTRESAEGLTIGEREALLLSLRQQLFGSRMDGYASCPKCEERLEFTLDAAEFLKKDRLPNEDERFVLFYSGYWIEYRLPTTRDLTSVAATGNVATARMLLAERCIVAARGNDGESVDPRYLSDDAVIALANDMEEREPQAELLLNLTCPRCQHEWSALFDAATYLWDEITREAKRLMQTVHTLARSYGWREDDILAMSAARRQAYVELATS